jgi:hypothetical protein
VRRHHHPDISSNTGSSMAQLVMCSRCTTGACRRFVGRSCSLHVACWFLRGTCIALRCCSIMVLCACPCCRPVQAPSAVWLSPQTAATPLAAPAAPTSTSWPATPCYPIPAALATPTATTMRPQPCPTLVPPYCLKPLACVLRTHQIAVSWARHAVSAMTDPFLLCGVCLKMAAGVTVLTAPVSHFLRGPRRVTWCVQLAQLLWMRT